jgi:hypothetical protein
MMKGTVESKMAGIALESLPIDFVLEFHLQNTVKKAW